MNVDLTVHRIGVRIVGADVFGRQGRDPGEIALGARGPVPGRLPRDGGGQRPHRTAQGAIKGIEARDHGYHANDLDVLFFVQPQATDPTLGDAPGIRAQPMDGLYRRFRQRA